jgi:hypothetical protein
MSQRHIEPCQNSEDVENTRHNAGLKHNARSRLATLVTG